LIIISLTLVSVAFATHAYFAYQSVITVDRKGNSSLAQQTFARVIIYNNTLCGLITCKYLSDVTWLVITHHAECHQVMQARLQALNLNMTLIYSALTRAGFNRL
jgi:hypothetical protein